MASSVCVGRRDINFDTMECNRHRGVYKTLCTEGWTRKLKKWRLFWAICYEFSDEIEVQCQNWAKNDNNNTLFTVWQFIMSIDSTFSVYKSMSQTSRHAHHTTLAMEQEPEISFRTWHFPFFNRSSCKTSSQKHLYTSIECNHKG